MTQKSKYKPYSKYKSSGVEWLGDMPEHWEIKKLKYIARTQPSNIDKKSKDGEPDVLLCNYTDVYYNDFITNEIDFMKATATYDQINKFRLDVGDVIITKDSEGPEDIAIAAYVKETQDNLVCGYHLTLIKPTECVGSYLFRAINSTGLHDQFKVAANGITRYGLSVYGINNVFLPIPSSKEQTTIANFLDRETAKIDTLIGKQERLIELLHEKRQALISHAVTKGLDPNVKMKESGVAWLGEVPEHWEIWKLSHAFNVIGSGTTPKSDNQDYYGGQIPWVTTGELRENIITNTSKKLTIKALSEYSALKLYSVGAVVIAMYGATIGRLGVLGIEATVNQACCVIDNSKVILNSYLYYWLMGYRDEILNLGYGGGQPNISQDVIVNLKVSAPSIEEQENIINYLDTQTSKIDTLVEKANQAIKLLKERRTAVISAAVTGKIDVRETV